MRFPAIYLLLIITTLFSNCNKPNEDPPNYAPTVTTVAATNITSTTVTLGGTITDEGSSAVTERGVCFGLSPNPDFNSGRAYSAGNGSPFSFNLSSLTPSTLYYVRAYAKNNTGAAFGNQVTFTTSSPAVTLPILTTTAVTLITSTTASSGGNINADGGAPVTARGVCWNTSAGPTIANSRTTDGTGTGSFTSGLSGLTGNTTYYVRSYATNSAGTAYGNELTFTTVPATSNVYVAGQEKNAAGKYVAKYWKNGVSVNLTDGTFDANAQSIFVAGNDVYVSGYEKNAANFRVAKYWKNGTPTILTNGTTNAEGWSIYVSGADIYVAGVEGQTGGTSMARYWKNGTGTTLSNTTRSAYATGIVVSGGNVYISGSEGNATGKYVAKIWTSGTGTDLTDGTLNADAWGLYVLGSDIYATGEIIDAGNIHHAKYWKNGVRTDLVNGSNCEGRSIAATATDVYVAGFQVFDQAKFWKNNVLTNLSPVAPGTFSSSVFVFGADVYVTGGEGNFARLWKNGTVIPLNDGTRQAAALAVFVTP